MNNIINKYIKIIKNWYLIMYSNVIKSFYINFNNIIFFLLYFFIIILYNININIITYIICSLHAYFYHYWSHMKISYPFTYGHMYHHYDSKNLFSIILEYLWEISFTLILLFLKLLLQLEYNIDLWFLNEESIIHFCIILISTHQINYTLLHVNTIHEKHHSNYFTNLCPELVDLFFCTKSDDEIENYSHVIPNVIIGLIIIYYLKKYWIKLDDNVQLNCKYVFIYGFAGLTILSLFINIFLCNEDLQEYLKNDLNSFCNKRENIKELEKNKDII